MKKKVVKNKKEAQKELEDTSSVVVLFFKTGCPACEAGRMPWNMFAQQMEPSPYRIVEIEEQDIPPDVMTGITAFPTYAKHDHSGSIHSVGTITSPHDIIKKLRIKR